MRPEFDVDWVISRWKLDPKTRFEFFWNSKPRGDGVLTTAVFSQWYPLGFTVDDIAYATAEHWMMAEKARLFRDIEACDAILETNIPGKAKALGRAVRGFEQQVWDQADNSKPQAAQ